MRHLPWLAAAAFVAACLVWLSRDDRISHHAFQPWSSHNSSSQGLSLASRYLAESGRTVAALQRPVDRAFLPADAVLFRVAPDPRAGDAKVPLFTAAEEAWMRGGGRLVLAIEKKYGDVDVRTGAGGPFQKSFPIWPGVERLDLLPARTLEGIAMNGAHALFLSGENPVVARLPMGRGEAILSAVPEIFQNGRLAIADHLAFLERLAGTDRPVFFDESVHGGAGSTGVLEILGAWGFGPFVLLAGLAALASF